MVFFTLNVVWKKKNTFTCISYLSSIWCNVWAICFLSPISSMSSAWNYCLAKCLLRSNKVCQRSTNDSHIRRLFWLENQTYSVPSNVCDYLLYQQLIVPGWGWGLCFSCWLSTQFHEAYKVRLEIPCPFHTLVSHKHYTLTAYLESATKTKETMPSYVRFESATFCLK